MSSVMPATADLHWYHGDTSQTVFRLIQDGNPIDLTGATIEAWAVNGRAPAHVLTTALGAGPGEIVVSPPTAGLDAGHYTYDLEITDAAEVTTWVRGRLDVDQDITNG